MSSSADLLTLFIGYVAMLALYAIPALTIFWKLFVKAGQPGWKAIIPAYNQYVMGVIAKRTTVGLVAAISYAIYLPLSYIQGNTAITAVAGLAALVQLIFGLAVLSLFIRQYDAGLGKWALFIFLPIIGVFLANSVKFKGSADAPAAAAAVPGQTPATTAPPSAAQPAAAPSTGSVTPEPQSAVTPQAAAATDPDQPQNPPANQ